MPPPPPALARPRAAGEHPGTLPARRHGPDEVHLYVLDYDARGLAPLSRLPHTGAYVGSDEAERTTRMLDLLDAEIDRRRRAKADPRPRSAPAAPAPRPALPLIVLLVDNVGALIEAFDVAGSELATRLGRIVRDGPGLGVCVVASSRHERGVPARIASQVDRKLLFRLADPLAVTSFGLRPREVPELSLGRAVDAATGLEVQLAVFAAGSVAAAVEEIVAPATAGGAPDGGGVTAAPGVVAPRTGATAGGDPALAPRPVTVLGPTVLLSEIDAPAVIGGGGWAVPIGLGAADLAPAHLTLGPGEHAVVGGPPRSGRSAALCAVAHGLRRLDLAGGLVAICPRRSPLAGMEGITVLTGRSPDDVDRLRARADQEPLVILVDDAELVPDDLGAVLAALAADRSDQRQLVVAGTPEGFRDYQGWTKPLRRSRVGLILPPGALDGDLVGVTLPGRRPAFPPGRGYLAHHGELTLVQVGLAPAVLRPGSHPTGPVPDPDRSAR